MLTSGNSATALSVASWNVLRDSGSEYALQAKRLPDILGVLANHTDTPFDFVGMYEVQGTIGNNPAQTIADELEMEQGFFAPYDNPVHGDGLAGAVGDRFTDLDGIVLDPDHKRRVAVIAQNDIETVAALHPSHNLLSGMLHRRRQIKELLKNLEGAGNTVVMGDFNAMPWYGSRRMLKRHGFISVLGSLDKPYPPTFPTDPEKADVGVPKPAQQAVKWLLKLLGGGSIDDIYVRGNHTIKEAGLFKQPGAEKLSDHYGLFATIEWVHQEANQPTLASAVS